MYTTYFIFDVCITISEPWLNHSWARCHCQSDIFSQHIHISVAERELTPKFSPQVTERELIGLQFRCWWKCHWQNWDKLKTALICPRRTIRQIVKWNLSFPSPHLNRSEAKAFPNMLVKSPSSDTLWRLISRDLAVFRRPLPRMLPPLPPFFSWSLFVSLPTRPFHLCWLDVDGWRRNKKTSLSLTVAIIPNGLASNALLSRMRRFDGRGSQQQSLARHLF